MRKPVPGSEPIKKRSPGKASEPIEVRKPLEVSEPTDKRSNTCQKEDVPNAVITVTAGR